MIAVMEIVSFLSLSFLVASRYSVIDFDYCFNLL